MLKKIVAVGLMVAALGAAASTVAYWRMPWPSARRRKSYSTGFALDGWWVNSPS